MNRAADDNNLMRSVLFESDGYFISLILPLHEQMKPRFFNRFLCILCPSDLNYAICCRIDFTLLETQATGKTL